MTSTIQTCFNHIPSKQNQRFFDIAQELRCLLLPIQGYADMPLVSLEDAVMPLTHLLPDIHTYVFMAKDSTATPPPDGLTLDESASICLYSIEWEPHDQCLSHVLNTTLRSKYRQKLNPWCLYLKLILTALSHIPSRPSRIIYRGIKSNLTKDYPVGKKLLWWGFSSCTASLSVLESMQFIGKAGIRTMFVIECNSSKDISKHTYFQSEQEVLILPATRFIVISYQNQNKGLHIIHLKEIPHPFILLQPVTNSNASLAAQPTRKSVRIVHKAFEKKRPSVNHHLSYWNSTLIQRICEQEFASSMNLLQEQLTDQDIPIIIEQGIIIQQCTILDLTGNEITSEGVVLLADGLNNSPTLKELILYNNHIDDKGVRSLALELSINNYTLKKLNLGCNDITDDGAQHLAQMLKTNRTLTHLWLQQNQIGDRGIQLLAGVLARHNGSLELLTISSNKFPNDSSVNALMDMLRLNQSLQKLDMNDCKLTDVNEAKLKNFIKSKDGFELII